MICESIWDKNRSISSSLVTIGALFNGLETQQELPRQGDTLDHPRENGGRVDVLILTGAPQISAHRAIRKCRLASVLWPSKSLGDLLGPMSDAGIPVGTRTLMRSSLYVYPPFQRLGFPRVALTRSKLVSQAQIIGLAPLCTIRGCLELESIVPWHELILYRATIIPFSASKTRNFDIKGGICDIMGRATTIGSAAFLAIGGQRPAELLIIAH